MKNLIDLANEYPELTVSIKLSDLIECNRQLIRETKNELEKQMADSNKESYPSIDEVATMLSVNKTTLWRWAKRNYLNPVEIGGKRRYRMSDVKKLLNSKQ